jgi:hypothetical protein
MALKKERINELLDGFDVFNPEDMSNMISLIHFIYRSLSSRDELLDIGERIIKKINELDVSVEDSTVTNDDGKESKVKDMLEFIQNELVHEEKSKVINERYKEIRKETNKNNLKNIKLDRLTRDRVQRKIMRNSQGELATVGLNFLIDEACGINNKGKEEAKDE